MLKETKDAHPASKDPRNAMTSTNSDRETTSMVHAQAPVVERLIPEFGGEFHAGRDCPDSRGQHFGSRGGCRSPTYRNWPSELPGNGSSRHSNGILNGRRPSVVIPHRATE